MLEYFGDSAKKYGQPQDKYFTLFPAIERALPPAAEKASALDLGCGNGVLFDLIRDRGYSYTGIDISQDMLNEATRKNPGGRFINADASKPIPQFTEKCDVIISNMLFPSLTSKSSFDGVFSVASTLLAEHGILILTAGHPCFDGYMQKHFFNRVDIETHFEGYFSSGSNYKVHRAIENRNFTFSDSHWTLSDYFESARKHELQVERIDECEPVGDAPEAVREKYTKKGAPSYLLIKLQRTCKSKV